MALSPEQLEALRARVTENKRVTEEDDTSFLDKIKNFFTDFTDEITGAEVAEQDFARGNLSEAQLEAARQRVRSAIQPEAGLTKDEDPSTVTDVGRGVLSGVTKIGEGVVTLGTTLVDLLADTDTTETVEEAFESFREAIGADPQGTAGEIAEALVQFGIPGLGAAGLVSKAGMAARGARSALGVTQAVTQANKLGFVTATPAVQAAVRAELIKETPRIVKHLKQIGAAATADMVVATDGVTTLGDFFEGGPTQTVKIGLEGREEALRQLKNRLKIGAESATIVGTLPLAAKAVSTTVKGAGQAVDPLTKPLMQKYVQPSAEKLGRYLDQAQFSESDTLRWLDRSFLSKFRSRGDMPEGVYDAYVGSRGAVQAELAEAKNNVFAMKRLMDKNLKRGLFSISRSSDDALARQEMYQTIESALAREKVEFNGVKDVDAFENITSILNGKLDDVGYKGGREWVGELANTVKLARNHIDRLSSQFADLPNLGDALESTIRENMGKYLTRVYELFTNKKWASHVKSTKKGAELIAEAKKDIVESMGEAGAKLTDDELNDIIDQILRVKPGTVTGTMEEAVLKVLPKGVLEQRKDISAPIRALMGEIRDPRSHYVHTVAKQAAYLADRGFYDTVAYKGLNETLPAMKDKVLASALAKAPKDELSQKVVEKTVGDAFDKFRANPRSLDANELDALKRAVANTDIDLSKVRNAPAQRYVYESVEDIPENIRGDFRQIGSRTADRTAVAKYGGLAGRWVRSDVLKAIERTSKFFDQDANMFFSLYGSTFLPLKGTSQYVKTVLSPITQVRNLLSASMFAMANGNVGFAAGQSRLGTSFRVVKNMVRNMDQGELDDLTRFLRENGVINTNVQVEEMRRLMGREAYMGDVSMLNTGEIMATIGAKGGRAAERVRGLRPLQFAQDLYQGSDDLWKTYSFLFERDKLIKAGVGRQEAMAQAAKIVRNTVPNYSAVPTFIKDLRVLPFGNFIAFPAEIMRTGYNILRQSVDEMASNNDAIRQIGLRRFFGLGATVYGSNVAVQSMANMLTGVTKDEMDLVQQFFVPEWQKNSVLVPTGRKKDGTINFIDFSYMNPYDYLRRPWEAVNNAVHEGNLRGLDVDEILLNAGIDWVKELVGPFATPSIMTQKLIDWKTGRTPEGRVIWRDEDPTGTKVAKGFLHTLEGITPPVLPMDTKGAPETLARGDFAHAGRFSTAALASITGEDNMDYRGKRYELGAELFRLMTGVTEQEVNFRQSLKYAGFEHGTARSDATRTFTSALTRGGRFTPEEAMEAYVTANNLRHRAFTDMYLKIQAAEKLGAGRRTIVNALKDAKVGDIGDLLRGRYVPYYPSDETIERIQNFPENAPRRMRNRLPLREMRAEYRRQKRRLLVPEPEPVVVPEAQVIPTQPQAAAPRQPAPQPTSVTAPVQPTPMAQPQLQRTPATLAALGLGPTEQLIAERQAMQQRPQGFSGGGPVKSGLKILGRSAAQVARRNELRKQIDPIKARMSELDEIIKDPSKGTARGAARLEKNKLESELKPLQDELFKIYADK